MLIPEVLECHLASTRCLERVTWGRLNPRDLFYSLVSQATSITTNNSLPLDSECVLEDGEGDDLMTETVTVSASLSFTVLL